MLDMWASRTCQPPPFQISPTQGHVPLPLSTVQELGAEVTCLSRKGEFVRLDVIGAKAHAVLSKVIGPLR
jgi:hypothetical protein